ncbi:menaquinone biosynthesis protein [Acidobacteria bacterium AH-259-L09]|nr:menaquinone biosynthesis protein [Acidobacteria bacterium AH-259-L09]
MKLRVSFIEYLNSVPLGWGFLNGPYQDVFEILFDVPSECARHLSTGEADIGLIPVIEYQRIPDLLVLPDIAVASKRQVKSVLFVSKVPLTQVSSVAVDSSSRTSVALLKILLHKFYGRHSVTYHQESPDPEKMLEHDDAALVIGNPALKVSRSTFFIYDLASEWHRFTGLPFVFAFWALRSGVNLGEKAQVFYLSREQGLKEIDSIARVYSEKLGVPAAEIRKYILENLNYSLDDSNLRGLQTFFELAAELELIPFARPLQFYAADQLYGATRRRSQESGAK